MQVAPRAWLEINSAALKHNLKLIKNLAPNSKLMAVIKANGYGHGLAVSAQALAGADEFATTDFSEAQALRRIDSITPITTLSADFSEADLSGIDGQNIRPVIFNRAQIQALESTQLRCPLNVWLKVDTGMGRLGFATDEIGAIAKQLSRFDSVASISLMTHLANADDRKNPRSSSQLASLSGLSSVFNWHEISALNSAGICTGLESNLGNSAQSVVRPGLVLYGISPLLSCTSKEGQLADEPFNLSELQQVMTFKARVISVKAVKAGTQVGYGGSYIAGKDTKLASISCGYADGYPRHAPSGTPVLIGDHVVPLVGRVSMDLITVDVQNLPIIHDHVATLWGPQNPVEVIAKMSETIPYELLVGIGARVQRKLVSST